MLAAAAKLTLGLAGVLAGYSAFVAFMVMHNFQASVWALLTGIVSSILFFLHWLSFRSRLPEVYRESDVLMHAHVGFWSFALGTCGLVYNLTVAVGSHATVLPVQDSHYIAAAWCLVTLGSGALLYVYGHVYAKHIANQRVQLLGPMYRPVVLP